MSHSLLVRGPDSHEIYSSETINPQEIRKKQKTNISREANQSDVLLVGRAIYPKPEGLLVRGPVGQTAW